MRNTIAGIVVCLQIFAQTGTGQHVPARHNSLHLAPAENLPKRFLDANRIKVVVNNRGFLNDGHPEIGAFIARNWDARDSTYHEIIYDQGPWIVGKLRDQVGGAASLWGSSFAPGPIIDDKPALMVHPEDAWRYHPYKITTGQDPSDSDYVRWPVDLGAPIDADGEPRILGNQSVWCVYNGGDSTVFPPGLSSAPFGHPLVEVQQMAFARTGSYSDTSLLANVVFFEWTFINKGTIPIDSCYLGFWTDVDFGNVLSNVPAIDTVAQTGYCWWKGTDTNDEQQYAVGHTLLYGPITPDATGDAIFRGRRRSGFRNLPLSTFWGITEAYPVDTLYVQYPSRFDMAWNFARGLNRSGHPITNPRTGEQTHFPYSGDPATGTGWTFDYSGYTGAEAGYMLFSGPFTFAPADTQWMMIALLPVDMNDFRESIRTLRGRASRLRALPYDSIAKPSPYTPYQPYVPAKTSLFQNFPNPFNGTTTINYEISERSQVRLVVYDILGREVRTVVQAEQPPGRYAIRLNADGLASGVYFIRLGTSTLATTRKMIVVR